MQLRIQSAAVARRYRPRNKRNIVFHTFVSINRSAAPHRTEPHNAINIWLSATHSHKYTHTHSGGGSGPDECCATTTTKCAAGSGPVRSAVQTGPTQFPSLLLHTPVCVCRPTDRPMLAGHNAGGCRCCRCCRTILGRTRTAAMHVRTRITVAHPRIRMRGFARTRPVIIGDPRTETHTHTQCVRLCAIQPVRCGAPDVRDVHSAPERCVCIGECAPGPCATLNHIGRRKQTKGEGNDGAMSVIHTD